MEYRLLRAALGVVKKVEVTGTYGRSGGDLERSWASGLKRSASLSQALTADFTGFLVELPVRRRSGCVEYEDELWLRRFGERSWGGDVLRCHSYKYEQGV